MHVCINTITWKAMPADLQCNRIAITRSVVSVLVQPVPAVPHEVRVEADDQISIRRLLLSDPVKHGVESTFTRTWNKTICFSVSSFPWISSVCVDPVSCELIPYRTGAVLPSCPSSPSQNLTREVGSWAAL